MHKLKEEWESYASRWTSLCIIQYSFKWHITYGWPGKTIGWQRNSSLHLCIAKQWDVTGSFTFFDFSTFQVVTMLLKIMTKRMAKTWMSHAEWHILKLLHLFWTSGCWWHRLFSREEYL